MSGRVQARSQQWLVEQPEIRGRTAVTSRRLKSKGRGDLLAEPGENGILKAVT